MDRATQMYREMMRTAIEDYEAGVTVGWEGQLRVCYQIALQIRELFEAGFRPAFTMIGITWKVPDGFNAGWLYSDCSCGYYSANPWIAAQMCHQSATFRFIRKQMLGGQDG